MAQGSRIAREDFFWQIRGCLVAVKDSWFTSRPSLRWSSLPFLFSFYRRVQKKVSHGKQQVS